MTDFFKSAFGNVFGSQGQGGGGGGGGGAGSGPAHGGAHAAPQSSNYSSGGGSGRNDFVGQLIQIGNMKFKVTKQLAEGGFAIVYVVQDLASGAEYALKVRTLS